MGGAVAGVSGEGRPGGRQSPLIPAGEDWVEMKPGEEEGRPCLGVLACEGRCGPRSRTLGSWRSGCC